MKVCAQRENWTNVGIFININFSSYSNFIVGTSQFLYFIHSVRVTKYRAKRTTVHFCEQYRDVVYLQMRMVFILCSLRSPWIYERIKYNNCVAVAFMHTNCARLIVCHANATYQKYYHSNEWKIIVVKFSIFVKFCHFWNKNHCEPSKYFLCVVAICLRKFT